MTGCRPAEIGFGVDGFDSLNPHQPLHAFAVHLQFHRHATAAREGAPHVQLVELPEQTQILLALRPRLVVVGGARQAQQIALLENRELRVCGIDPSAAILNR